MNPIQFDARLPHPYDANPDWQKEAACRNQSTELFFPSRGVKPQDVKRAKLICAECPIKQKCLDYALWHNETHGIWGGLSENERRKLRKQIKVNRGPTHRKTIVRSNPPSNFDNCGTYSGFFRHLRAKEQPCEPCRIMKNMIQARKARERRAQHKPFSPANEKPSTNRG